MNNNIIPSIIIASAILLTGYIFHVEIDKATSFSPEKFVSGLEKLALAKDSSGESIIKNSVSKIAEDLSTGIKQGFSNGMSVSEKSKINYSDLVITNVKFVNGRMDNAEKIIGLIHNKSNITYKNFTLSVNIKDKDGNLIDVISEFSRVDGEIGPNKELGFGIERSFKPFGDKSEGNEKRGFSADVTITKCDIVK